MLSTVNTTSKNAAADELRPLARAQNAVRSRPSDSARNMFTTNSKSIASTPQSVTTTVSNMENNIQSALLLKSAHEYRHWLGTYVRFLAKENMQNKIRETFDMLMGPAQSSVAGVPCARRDANEPAWEPKILGMSK